MPVDFLTAEQTRRYGRYHGAPTPAQLAHYFFLNDQERSEIAAHRGVHNRLGYAAQLCTVRFLGTFLPNPTELPRVALRHLACQLGIKDPSCLARYAERPATYTGHAAEIRQRHGYRDFHSQPEHWRLTRWLYTRAWLSAERPIVLFDLTTARLVERKVLLPGVTTLARFVASVRDRAAERLWKTLAELPDLQQRQRLEALLLVPETSRLSTLDRLRKLAVNISAPGMVEALLRLNEFRALQVQDLPLSRLPPGRVKVLARYAAVTKAQSLTRLHVERRLATLLAFARVYGVVAQDDAVELLNQLIAGCLRKANRKGETERLKTLADLDRAALRLREGMRLVLDSNQSDTALRAAIFALIPREQLEQDVHTVGQLSREEDEFHHYEHLIGHYNQMRRFLPLLLQSIEFDGTAAARPVLDALAFLKCQEAKRDISMAQAPRSVVDASWHNLVFSDREVPDQKFYTLCTLARLRDGLHRRDIYLSDSERWGDPCAKLLQGNAWSQARPAICRTLGRHTEAEPELKAFEEQLSEAYRRAGESLAANDPEVRIEKKKGRDRLCLTPLDKLDEPASLLELRRQVNALMPRVDLPEALLEVQTLTGFADEFQHLNEREKPVADLALSVCAVLTAEACNIPLEPVVQNDVPALSYARLAWVQQNHLRAETLSRANARLIKEHARIPLVKVWGGGEVASADGLRFVVPVKTLYGGHNSKYFHAQRGVTYYNFVSDQFSGIHGIVIPGTLGESPYLLDGLLEHQTELQPQQVITDTAGYSDLVFGLFWLLGFQFSPRLAELGAARFWRMNPKADYGALNNVGRHLVRRDLITAHWDEFLHIAGSLKMGTVKPSELIRGLQRGKTISTLGRALGELGRIPKTLHLLHYIANANYRRHCLTQLNRHEGRNGLARRVFHGQKGELRQRYREGQEDQLGALGLVVNALVFWTTRYMDAALSHLRSNGTVVRPEDVARLSPLGSQHFNVLGRYHFALHEAVRRGELRPLRDTREFEQELLIA
jgi:TnpA family transposase